MAQTTYDIIVLGAGPAGIAAGLYAGRAGRRTLIIDRGLSGGTLGSMQSILDFPGVGDKPSGEALIKRMRWQAKDAGADFREAEVTSTALGASGRMVFAKDNRGEQKYTSRAIILATGAGDRLGTVPGEEKLRGKGVSYSVVRDAYSFAKQPVAVYGKSIAAADAALDLVRASHKAVHFIIPSNRIDAPDTLNESLKKHDKIHLHFSSSLKEIVGEDAVTGVTVLGGGSEQTLDVSAIFLYNQTHQVEPAYLAGTVTMGDHGILVDPQLCTSIPGVFACGDILTGDPQIPVIASAQGVMAALSADRFLQAEAG